MPTGMRLIKMRKNIMKKMRNDPDLLKEYDFSKGIKGKYSQKYSEGTNVVVIEPDVAKYFPDHDSVNQALRSLTEIIKKNKRATKSLN